MLKYPIKFEVKLITSFLKSFIRKIQRERYRHGVVLLYNLEFSFLKKNKETLIKYIHVNS